MSCGFDKGVLAALYDGETTPEERAEADRHLAGCPECARDLASMKRLSGVLKPLAHAPAPVSIAEGVIREIGGRRSAPRPWFRWGLTAAASLLVAGGVFIVLDRSSQPEAKAPVAAAERPATKPAFTRKEDGSKLLGRADDEAPPAESPAAPAAEMRSNLDDLKKMYRDWEGMPIVRVKSLDPAAARAVVVAYLKEKKLQEAPDGPALNPADRYLRVDLTDAEAAELEKRLSGLQETSLARETIQARKKAGEELDKSKDAPLADADSTEQKMKESRSRGARAESQDLESGRRRVLYYFENSPPK